VIVKERETKFNPRALTEIKDLLNALSGESYIETLFILYEKGELSPKELAQELSVTNGRACQILKNLRERFILRRKKKGRKITYALTGIGRQITEYLKDLYRFFSLEDSP